MIKKTVRVPGGVRGCGPRISEAEGPRTPPAALRSCNLLDERLESRALARRGATLGATRVYVLRDDTRVESRRLFHFIYGDGRPHVRRHRRTIGWG
jgi:hypothetical protein